MKNDSFSFGFYQLNSCFSQKGWLFSKNHVHVQKECRLVFSVSKAVSPSLHVRLVRCTAAFFIDLLLVEDDIQNAIVEVSVDFTKWTMKDVNIREPTRQIKEQVELVLAQHPCGGENAPKALQSAKEALDQNSFRPVLRLVLVAYNDRRNVVFRPAIPKVRQHRAALEHRVHFSGVRPENCDVRDAAGE